MRNLQANTKSGEIYLNQIQNQQLHHQPVSARASMGNLLASNQVSSITSQSSFEEAFPSSSPTITTAPASSSTVQQAEYDLELNELLENVIELDETNFGDDILNYQMHANANAHLKQQEEMAQINKIQQSLMECENEDNFTGSPPAYPLHVLPAQNRLAPGFNQPPPGYSHRNTRMPLNASNNNIVSNSTTATAAHSSNSQQGNKQPNALMIQRLQLQQQQQRILQQQQKERLLQQQQNQQIVVTAGADQLCKCLWLLVGFRVC
jgi:nuclear receptor coactivator 2